MPLQYCPAKSLREPYPDFNGWRCIFLCVMSILFPINPIFIPANYADAKYAGKLPILGGTHSFSVHQSEHIAHVARQYFH